MHGLKFNLNLNREVGELATDGSKRCITVSTVAEAEFYADGGFDDILYACPFTPDKMDRYSRSTEVSTDEKNVLPCHKSADDAAKLMSLCSEQEAK